MGRPIHFEIYVKDMERAKKFYSNTFGWTFEDYSEYVGAPYFGVITGEESEPGINGALTLGEDSNNDNKIFCGSVLTIGVEDYDTIEKKILESGGKVQSPKYPLLGMAWQGYYLDTEENIFGIHQPDENAK
ncbi:MAG: VOC family protein [Tissierellia bacterium]|jgi:predicted enzyme related to lactoylglutathione lyase|nr:VOC family protein [Tissierellia bacterium]